MLQTLSIRDFAIIDRVELELGPGLTVITGETGAGKSILIDALDLVLGGRARTEVVRAGTDSAQVEALFSLEHAPAERARLAELGVDGGDTLVVRRIVSQSGRHRVYVNGTLATVAMLGELTAGLVDISGQHEHYSLLRTESHLELLDRVAGLGDLREVVAAEHAATAALDDRLAELRAQQRGRAEREDFLRFQLQELEAAELDDTAEEEALERECGVLRNAEKLRENARSAEHALYSEDGAAVERLDRAARSIRDLARLDPELQPLADDLETARALAADTARSLGTYARKIMSDPQRLDLVETRLALFARLRRKYAITFPELVARQKSLREELDSLERVDHDLDDLVARRRAAAGRLVEVADRLTAARQAAGERVAAEVAAELADLAMPGATLVVQISPATTGLVVRAGSGERLIGARGADRVEVLLSANPGLPAQPLNRIASGGELSRFMLAVKRVIAERDPVPTYVFDEVDAGVGGATAVAIGRKVKTVSARRQVLCITHLPQIAAFADHHLRVVKRIEGNTTESLVQALEGDERVDEVARMLGGERITETSRAHARELLGHAG